MEFAIQHKIEGTISSAAAATRISDCLALTEFEAIGLRSPFNFADGHSYVNPKEFFPRVEDSLADIWNWALRTSIPDMERQFKSQFASFYKLRALQNLERFAVCPSASNSIDLVGAWLATMKCRVGLLEPTFDNLALLLRRRGVPLVGVSEAEFTHAPLLKKKVETELLDALFVVNPNNPTGTVWEKDSFSAIIELCLQEDLVLIVDSSFRFTGQASFDDYELLESSGVKYICLEDTGKLWPAMDTKASLLSSSTHCWKLLRAIYDEVYLCSSNYSIALLSEFIRNTSELGGISYVHQYIRQRRNIALKMLKNTQLSLAESDPRSVLSLLWLDCSRTGKSDVELAQALNADGGFSILPGRYFYWGSHEKKGHDRVRVSLMKPLDTLMKGVRGISLHPAVFRDGRDD